MKLAFITILLFAFVAAVVAVTLLGKLRARVEVGKYRRRKLMTDNELEFFGRLRTALPDYLVFPQVAMTAVIEACSGDQKAAHRDRLRIAQQRIDYLVCDFRGEVVAVVELDDRTHSAEKDRVRDERLQQTGIKTIRFQSRNKPAPDVIRAVIRPLLIPTSETAATVST